MRIMQPAVAQRDAFGALVVGDFVANPFADGLTVEVQRYVGIDEVETGFRAVGDGACIVDPGRDAAEGRRRRGSEGAAGRTHSQR